MDRRRKEGKEREARGTGGKEGAGEESEGGRLMERKAGEEAMYGWEQE